MHLKKNSQKEIEQHFSGNLDDLFDIAYAESLNITQLPENKDFLQAQRKKGRRGCIGAVNMVLSRKESKIRKRLLETETSVAKRMQ